MDEPKVTNHSEIDFLKARISLLTPEDQTLLFIQSLELSSKEVKWKVKNWINNEFTRDFMTLLPSELQLKILEYLDSDSLLVACQVSKSWYRKIGVNLSLFSSNWHQVYFKCIKRLKMLKCDEEYKPIVFNLQNNDRIVHLVNYKNGYLCTVCEDNIVSIWKLYTNCPIASFYIKDGASCLQFDPNLFFVCGNYMGVTRIFDLNFLNILREMKLNYDIFDGELCLYKKFEMHSGGVLSCNYSLKLDLVVSSGADFMTKFWSISSGDLLHTLRNDGWALKSIFMPTNDIGMNTLIIGSTMSIKKYVWPSKSIDDSPKTALDREIKELNPDCDSGEIKSIEEAFSISINNSEENYEFLPEVEVCNDFLGFVKQDKNQKYTHLCKYNLDNFELLCETKLNFKVNKLLALGNNFALALSPGRRLFTSDVIILNVSNGEQLGCQSIPHCHMTTPSGSQIAVGDREWLDGLSGEQPFKNINDLDHMNIDSFDNFVNKDESYIERKINYVESILTPSEDTYKIIQKVRNRLKIVTPLYHKYPDLILAAGIRNMRGELFTLWWSCEKFPNKKSDYKKD